MKINLCTLAALLSCTGFAKAQENYDVTKIPAELLKNSTAIVRNEESNVTVKSPYAATMSYKTAITILSKGGDINASMTEYYDKSSSVYNLKATMYDAKGVKIKSYKNADFKDEGVSSMTIDEDSRVKRLVFLNSNYPYTIEYSYDKDYNGFVLYPSWQPVKVYDAAIEKSAYTFQIPKGITFKYLKNEAVKTDSVVTDNKIIYKWACQNLPAYEYEPLTTGLETIAPWVNISPNKFEYSSFKGDVENWKNLGSWIYQLAVNTQTLPEKTKGVVRELTAAAKTDQEKIDILYRYLQSNTRYVSIQLGIGGFRPMTAEKVATVNYGDCKALSNYMKTLLAEAGIKSDVVTIGNGKRSLNAKYSSFGQTNHEILCVPLGKDTTWLECTSQHYPTGYLGNSNAARVALLATEEGGILVKTPAYMALDNYQNSRIAVVLTPDGSADVQINTLYGAAQYEDRIGIMLMEPTEQRKNLMNRLGLPNMEITAASFTQPDKKLPKIEEKISLKSTQLMNQAGDKLFLTLNLLNRRESVPQKVENRKTPFSLPYGFNDIDEVIYTLPKGYKVEFLPKDILLESEFGKYTAKATLKDDKIVYTRSQTINSNEYKPEKYADLIAFYKKIYLADKQKAVLAKIN